MSNRKKCDNYLCFTHSINNYEKYCVSCFNKTHISYTLYCDDIDNITKFYLGSPTNKPHQEQYNLSFCSNTNRELYNKKLYKFIQENGGWDNLKFNIIDTNVMEITYNVRIII